MTIAEIIDRQKQVVCLMQERAKNIGDKDSLSCLESAISALCELKRTDAGLRDTESDVDVTGILEDKIGYRKEPPELFLITGKDDSGADQKYELEAKLASYEGKKIRVTIQELAD